MSVLEAAINAVGKYSWRTMLGIFIASGVLLFFGPQLDVADWTKTNRGWLILAFAVSGGVLLSYVISGFYQWISRYVIDTRVKRLGKKHLRQLTDDEKVVCRHFVQNNGSAYRTTLAQGEVAALVVKNVLFRPGGPYPGDLYDFQIQPWALEYLKKHPELLKGAS